MTRLAELDLEGHRTEIREEEPGLIGIGVDPPVGIGQRSLLVTDPQGNLLWDVPGFVDVSVVLPEARRAITDARSLEPGPPGTGSV